MIKIPDTQAGNLRPPIVVVLGHVDHGKTSLLDRIRKTDIAAKEAGGITQGIGASVVTGGEGKKITFIDTPGHAAFAKMRSRGARVADIAILAVAADDGVKPQTKEALEHILSAKIPFIVAVTKTDLPSASIEAVVSQLEKEGVAFEGKGGNTPLVATSAKKAEGIDALLEMISLVAEVNEIKASQEDSLEAVVIETGKGKAGLTVSAIIRNGSLKVGDKIATETVAARVRGLFDFRGGRVKEVFPGEPVAIIGFEGSPEIGSYIRADEGQALMAKSDLPKGRMNVLSGNGEKEKTTPILLKADNSGALEAILANIPKEVVVISFGVGDINESDVLFAKSTKARILGFKVKASPSVVKLAEEEGVGIQTFNIIYKLFESLEEILDKKKTISLGEAKILANFPFEGKKIAGCKVIKGKITKGDTLILKRGEMDLGQAKAVSMRKGKDDIPEARQGEEFGLLLSPQLDFGVGDVLLSLEK